MEYDQVTACKTPWISKATDMYSELFRRMKADVVIHDIDRPGVSIRAKSLRMYSYIDSDGNILHKITAYGSPVNTRREYPQKPNSGLIEEE